MSLFGHLLVIAVVLQVSLASRWRFGGRSPRCLKITDETAPLCANLSKGYDEMMLPNFLGHDKVKEVKQELGQWAPLVGSGCHPYLKHFLCSIFAPVCMVNQPPIGPCRSLCSMVQISCEPLMRMHNYSWPPMLNCSQYKENDLCVSIPAPTTPVSNPSVCVDDNDGSQNKMSLSMLKKKFCEANFTFKGRVQERKERNGIIILKLKVNPHPKYLRNVKQGILRLRVPITNRSQCKGAQKRKQFLVFGTFRKGKRLVVTHLLKWKKWKRLSRKLNKKSCKKY